MKVTDPTGQPWRVSRRWVPWRRRLKGWGVPDISFVFADGIVGLVLGVLIGVPLLLLALAISLEFLALLVVFPIVLLARVFFGRAWVVEVRKGWRPYWEEKSGDWRASRLRIREVAASLEQGKPLPQNLGEPPSVDQGRVA